MRTRRWACTAVVASTPDTIAGASNATCPSPRCDSTTVPSSRNSGSIAANRAIAASCTADATLITRCTDPTAAAHCSSDPATADASNAPQLGQAASHASCTCTGPLTITLHPLRPRYRKPTGDH